MKPRVILPSIASGFLLWLAFFPVNLGIVAYIALVPFLTLVRAEGISRGRRYLAAWLGGLTFGIFAANWLRVAHPMMAYFGWPFLAFFLSLFWPWALSWLRRLDALGKPPLALTLPVVWVALEYFKAHFPTGYPFLKWIGCFQHSGFAWYFLGHTQHANIPLLQAADLGGAYLISAAVAAVNGAIYDWAMRMNAFRWLVNWPRGWRPPTFRTEMMATAGALFLLGGSIFYGTARLNHAPFEVGPRVALLQDDLSQEILQSDSAMTFSRYDKLARGAFRTSPQPDLIVWPEACFPLPDFTPTPGERLPEHNEAAARERLAQHDRFLDENLAEGKITPEEHRTLDLRRPEVQPYRELIALGREKYAEKYWKTYSLLGTNGIDLAKEVETKHNSARLLRPDGTPAERYDKIHLVPFGEYVPFRETLPWLENFTPNPKDPLCRPGDKLTRFELPTAKTINGKTEIKIYRFGVIICYEDTEPTLARRYNRDSGEANPADFLVNMSLDSWFSGTEQHEQHLAISRFRAVEARRSLVRAVNQGISALIDPDGRIKDLPEGIDKDWSASKNVKSVLAVDIPIDRRGSPYAAIGDWVPGLCWAGIAAGLMTLLFRAASVNSLRRREKAKVTAS